MKIACAQINQVVGDFSSNLKRIDAAIDRAEQAGADLVVFPETATLGVYASDLLLNDRFVRDNLALLDRITAKPKRIGVLIGYVRPSSRGNKLENAAALIDDGQIVSTHVKTRLAVHGAYDEHRYFEPGESVKPVSFRGTMLGVTICEDICRPEYQGSRPSPLDDPTGDAVARGAEFIINLAASPYTLENQAARTKILKECALAHHRPIVFTNHVGGNDEWIFDGQSMVLNAEGMFVAVAESFAEDLLVVDMEADGHIDMEIQENDIDTVIHALIQGTRDFVRKRGRQSVLVAVDGEAASSAVAAVAAAAIGADKVFGIRFGATSSLSNVGVDVADLAACIGIRVNTYREEELILLKSRIGAVAGRSGSRFFKSLELAVRQMLLNASAEDGGHILLTCDDKTDLYLSGPSLPSADLGVLSDIPKSMLYRVARQLGDMGIAPLRKIQRTMPDGLSSIFEDSLEQAISVDEVDTILDHLISEKLDAETIISLGCDPSLTERIVQKVKRTESLRLKAPPKLNITSKAFGFYSHLPLCREPRSAISDKK
jgi:predicted amidohydrolase/NH3-dependent NAD+ synthetase